MRSLNPFAPPPSRKPQKVKRDTDAERAEKAYVRARDRGCVVRHLKAPDGTPVGLLSPCDGPLDVDHVRASGGLGMKSETTRRNMAVLCRWHHDRKTNFGKTWRPMLIDYIERVEGPAT